MITGTPFLLLVLQLESSGRSRRLHDSGRGGQDIGRGVLGDRLKHFFVRGRRHVDSLDTCADLDHHTRGSGNGRSYGRDVGRNGC